MPDCSTFPSAAGLIASLLDQSRFRAARAEHLVEFCGIRWTLQTIRRKVARFQGRLALNNAGRTTAFDLQHFDCGVDTQTANVRHTWANNHCYSRVMNCGLLPLSPINTALQHPLWCEPSAPGGAWNSPGNEIQQLVTNHSSALTSVGRFVG